jgi:hypothetical protein
MAVTSVREVVGRGLTHEFGKAPSAERKFVCSLDDPNTPTQDIINAVGIAHLAPHPEYGFLYAINGTFNEGSPTPFHAEATISYGVPQEEDRDANPLTRQDIWSFSTSGAAVPAFFYYDGTTQKVLVNTANDFFEGAQTEEAEVRATIQGNRVNFPVGLAAQVTNCVNNATYLGAPPHHWKCAGISAAKVTEVVNDVEIKYWQVTSELVYRQSGWSLQLPNVGYNYLEGGQKKRAYVIDPDDGTTKIPCANPVALNTNGSMKTSGPPEILVRRVHKEVDFQSLFGTPPT